MVSAIGSGGLGRTIQLQGEGVARGTKAARTAATNAEPTALASPAAELAAAGAPIDVDRVAALKAAIANGTYKVDPDAIAARMIAMDLPQGA